MIAHTHPNPEGTINPETDNVLKSRPSEKDWGAAIKTNSANFSISLGSIGVAYPIYEKEPKQLLYFSKRQVTQGDGNLLHDALEIRRTLK